MKYVGSWFLTIFFILTAGFSNANEMNFSPAEQEIVTFSSDWARAYRNGDLKTLETMLTEDFISEIGGTQFSYPTRLKKTQYLKEIEKRKTETQNAMVKIEIKLKNLEITVMGSEAIFIETFEMTGKGSNIFHEKWTTIFSSYKKLRKIDGNWKMYYQKTTPN